jgi:hypothetical protein
MKMISYRNGRKASLSGPLRKISMINTDNRILKEQAP